MPRFLKSHACRDSECPEFFDLNLDTAKLARSLRGEPEIGRLCRKLDLTSEEVIRRFSPGARLDADTGEVDINAGYDAAHDEGRLEELIWELVRPETEKALADDLPGLRARQVSPSP
jgi:hypothetical protein